MEKFQMRHGSLFAGIGGFDLAADWMGWKNIFHCETNPFCQRILNYYYPEAKSYGDIKTTDFSVHKGQIDILTGGFPCQPYSVAGKRLGTSDERHLWPYMLSAIRQIKPQWVVAENVAGIISWNEGLVFEEVQTDLETEGYEVQPFVLPAAGVGAPHRRERVWFIAYAEHNDDIGKKRGVYGEKESLARKHWKEDRPTGMSGRADQYDAEGSEQNRYDYPLTGSADGPASHGNSDQRFQGRGNKVVPEAAERQPRGRGSWHSWDTWQDFPTQSPVCHGDDGLSGRLDAITFYKWRSQSIMAGGNAIVPQVAYQIFQAIEQFNHELKMRS